MVDRHTARNGCGEGIECQIAGNSGRPSDVPPDPSVEVVGNGWRAERDEITD